MALIFDLLESQYLIQGVLSGLVLIFVTSFYQDLADGFPYRKIPLVGRGRWELSNTKAKHLFVSSAKGLLQQGFTQGKKVFQIMTSSSPTIVLHHSYINEIKAHPDLNFDEANKKSFFGSKIPGFEAFDGLDKEGIVLDVINKKLTHTLGQITLPLSKETAYVFQTKLGKTDDWKSFAFAQEIPHIVAQLSSLVFLGEKICRDPAWLNVSVNYTIDAFVAARDLRLYPSLFRPLVHWFLPSAKRLRNHVANATKIVQAEIDKRELIRHGKLPEENPPRSHEDSLDWFREVAAGRPFNVTRSQIGLSLAAIHTTSNLITNVIYDLTAYPEFIQPLRDEIKAVVEEDGMLKKTSLTKLKLMDSVMKESQRMNPAGIVLLSRVATRKIALSDGTCIPKGAILVVSTLVLEDEELYPGANKYDGYRFYRKRQEPGNEHRFQFVTTSPEHFGFGHGQHACPGRFFAANEIKILLVHLLMKYDWKFEGESTGRPPNFMHGTESICNPMVKLLYKSREPEINLSLLGEVNV